MPKKSHNALIGGHKDRLGVAFHFSGFYITKKDNKGKVRSVKGGPVRFTNGKVLPTPSQTINRLAASVIKGDYSSRSENGGASQVVMCATREDAEALRNAGFEFSPWKKSDGNPFTVVTG